MYGGPSPAEGSAMSSTKPARSEIRVELLRPGDLHGQLLSRLTPYIAVTDERHVETLQLPFDHLHLVRAQSSLAAATQPAMKRQELDKLGESVAQVIGRISQLPGLLSGADQRLRHLRLTLAGHELAMIPWEASQLPSGAGAAAQKLLLQSTNPVVLTRELRESSQRRFDWSRAPRVLLAASGPLLPSALLRAHVLAFYRALQPFVRHESHVDHAGHALRDLLHVLPSASLDEIQDTCRRSQLAFTHIVILAHGRSYLDSGQPRYGVELYHPQLGSELVDGERLVQAIYPVSEHENQDRCPLFATLLVCHGDSAGNVVLPFGSLAHQLHSGGIPWVVGSQFPLSMNGSARFCETFFPALFNGEDPRQILFRVRQDLYTAQPNHSDWASLTVYASFSHDFERQLLSTQRIRLHGRMSILFNKLDSPPRTGLPSTGAGGAGGAVQRNREELLKELVELAPSIDALVAACAATNDRKLHAESLTTSGSYYRNLAFIQFFAAADDHRGNERTLFISKLLCAHRDYINAANQYPQHVGNAVHALSLSWFMGHKLDRVFWMATYHAAFLQISSEPITGWGYAAMIELILISKLYRDLHIQSIAKQKYGHHVNSADEMEFIDWCIAQIVNTPHDNHAVIRRLNRQLERYVIHGRINNLRIPRVFSYVSRKLWQE